ncbi:heparin lyase I family protein [Coraliomargarita sp. W4R53]
MPLPNTWHIAIRYTIPTLLLLNDLAGTTTDYEVDWDFESPGYIAYEVVERPASNGWYHRYYEDGQLRNMPTDDWPNGDFFITDSLAYSGSKSLIANMFANNNGDKDRLELEFANWSEPHRLAFDEDRYVSYRVYIDDISGVFDRHFTQVWQPHVAARVPFTMSFVADNGDWRWEAVARDFNGNYPIASQPIAKGQWHTFIYRFLPRHADMLDDGIIQIWLNGVLVGDYVGPWGEKPGNTWPGYAPTEPTMSIRCGLYAGPANVNHPEQALAFDELRMGTTYASVATETYTIELEAEDGIMTGPMASYGHPDASFGQFIEQLDGSAGTGYADYTFNVAEAGTYNVWLLAYGETGNDDSIFLKMNSDSYRYCAVPIGNTFTWKKMSEAQVGVINYSLSAGTNTLSLKRRESGARIDRIYITKTTSLPPAALTPRNRIELEAEDARITAPFVIATAPNASGSKYVTQDIGVAGDGYAEYDFYLPQAGTYNIWLSAYGATGTNDSFKIAMNEGSENDCAINQGSDFTWREMKMIGGSTLSFTLAAGHHSLKIKKRETGARVDRVAIVEQSEVFAP